MFFISVSQNDDHDADDDGNIGDGDDDYDGKPNHDNSSGIGKTVLKSHQRNQHVGFLCLLTISVTDVLECFFGTFIGLDWGGELTCIGMTWQIITKSKRATYTNLFT